MLQEKFKNKAFIKCKSRKRLFKSNANAGLHYNKHHKRNKKKEDIQLIQMLMRLMDCNKQKGKSFKTRKHIKAVTKNLTKYKKVD